MLRIFCLLIINNSCHYRPGFVSHSVKEYSSYKNLLRQIAGIFNLAVYSVIVKIEISFKIGIVNIRRYGILISIIFGIAVHCIHSSYGDGRPVSAQKKIFEMVCIIFADNEVSQPLCGIYSRRDKEDRISSY